MRKSHHGCSKFGLPSGFSASGGNGSFGGVVHPGLKIVDASSGLIGDGLGKVLIRSFGGKRGG